MEDEIKAEPIVMDFEFKGQLDLHELKEILIKEIKDNEKAPFGDPEFEKKNPIPPTE